VLGERREGFVEERLVDPREAERAASAERVGRTEERELVAGSSNEAHAAKPHVCVDCRRSRLVLGRQRVRSAGKRHDDR